MKIIIQNALSLDGFIARPDGTTDWVSAEDNQYWQQMVETIGWIVMGRKTFDKYQEIFPIKGVTNIVMTKNRAREKTEEQLVITTKTPQQVVQLAKQQGAKQLLVIGGGQLNNLFLQAGLVDEVILSYHPVILGQGIKVFGEKSLPANITFTLLEQQNKLSLLRLRYAVRKK